MERESTKFNFGCFFSLIFIVLYLWICPSFESNPGYFFLWLIGFLFFPLLISIVFGLGQASGFIVSFFSNIFNKKNIIEEEKKYNKTVKPKNPVFINIDKYNYKTDFNSYNSKSINYSFKNCSICHSSDVITTCDACGKYLCKNCVNDGNRCYGCYDAAEGDPFN